jgi:catechol 2,3-dioxygenase-like lactoylglutathione lyase family enzyme
MKQIFLFLVLLSFSKNALAQESPSLEFVFNHISLSVKDVDVSASFYKAIFNLQEIENRGKIEGIRWFSLGEGKELHLISVIKSEVIINKAVHFALTTSTFDAFVANLEYLNIPFTDWPGETNKVTLRADGIKQVYIQDPDGYWIEVNSVAEH